MRVHSLPLKRWKSRTSDVPKPRTLIVARRVIDEMAATATPTEEAGKKRAATTQYAEPTTDVTAVVATMEKAFAKIGRRSVLGGAEFEPSVSLVVTAAPVRR